MTHQLDDSVDIDFITISFDVDFYIENSLDFLPYINELLPHYTDEFSIIRNGLDFMRNSYINTNNGANIVTYKLGCYIMED